MLGNVDFRTVEHNQEYLISIGLNNKNNIKFLSIS
ncbi:hypothetical protein TASCI_130003 [Tenacibaculum ascidiaceicola]